MVPENQTGSRRWLLGKWWPKTLKNEYRSTAIGLPFSRWISSLRYTPLHVRVISTSEFLGLPKQQAGVWKPVIKLVALPTDFQEFLEIVPRGDSFLVRERQPHPWLTSFVEGLNREDGPSIENHWFVFPELTVFSGTRERMQQALEKLGSTNTHIIAGSEHIDLNGMNANRSCLLSCMHPTPESIYHLKKFGVRFRPAEFQRVSEEGELQYGNADQEEITELLDMVGGTPEHPLICLETAWGRVSFTICRDALEEDNPMLKCMRIAEVDHLFVISLNPGTPSEFEALGRKLAKHQIATYYVNTQLPGKKDPLIMVHLPTKTSDHSLAKAFVPRETQDHASGSFLDHPGSGITASVEDGVHCCTIDLAQLISWLPAPKK